MWVKWMNLKWWIYLLNSQWEECVQPVCMSAVGQTNVTNTAALNKKAEKNQSYF